MLLRDIKDIRKVKIELNLTDRAVQTIAKHKAFGQRIASVISDKLQEAINDAQRYIQQEELTGQLLNVRTGSLRRSIKAERVQQIGNIISGRVGVIEGTASKYAHIQEVGGQIRSVKGRYLAIPLPSAKTPRGVIKGKYNVPLRSLKLAIFRSKAGNLILAERKKLKTKTKIIPLFVLKRSVTITGKQYMQKAANRLKDRLLENLRLEFEKSI